MQSEAEAKACCADLYQSDMAKLIMGDTLHPGGLGLTNKLGRLMGLQPGELVADLASARGESAQALGRVFRCNVLGVEFGAEAVSHAGSLAPAAGRAHFVRGDAECLPLRSGVFDAAVCECSMSLFINKAQAMAEAARLLRPGGRFGLSDVTIEEECYRVGCDDYLAKPFTYEQLVPRIEKLLKKSSGNLRTLSP